MCISIRRSTNTYTKAGTSMNTVIRNNSSTGVNIKTNMLIRTRKNIGILVYSVSYQYNSIMVSTNFQTCTELEDSSLTLTRIPTRKDNNFVVPRCRFYYTAASCVGNNLNILLRSPCAACAFIKMSAMKHTVPCVRAAWCRRRVETEQYLARLCLKS